MSGTTFRGPSAGDQARTSLFNSGPQQPNNLQSGALAIGRTPAQPSPEVTAPAIDNRTPFGPARNPELSGRPAVPSIAPSAENANAFFQSVNSLIDDAVKPNALNQYFQSTYHFRLFMAEDGDMIAKTGASTILGLHAGIDAVNQITIAESGVTGFNIKEVHLTTVAAANPTTRSSTATNLTMTINEPGGISFLDALHETAAALRVKNYTKALFYLELKFLGYNEEGKFVGSLAESFNSRGRWIWSLVLTTLDVKLNEGGGLYTLKFQSSNSAFLTEDYDVLRAPVPISATGKDVRTLFADYLDQLNQAWTRRYGASLVKFDKIVTNPVSVYYKNPPGAASLNPGDFVMKAPEPNKNPNHNWAFDQKSGEYKVNIVPGYTIQEFIVDAIKHTEQGQALAKDDMGVKTRVDASQTQTNERKFRESITWSVETRVSHSQFDTVSKNYVRHVSFYVTPHYSQQAIASRLQVDLAKDPDQQHRMVKNLIDMGMLRKRYDYIFTSLNTEVIDFDLSFNMTWNAVLPNYGGALMRHEALHVNATQSAVDRSPDANRSESDSRVNFVDFDKPQPPNAGSAAPNPVQTPARVAGGTGPEVGAPTNNFYIEDLLSQQTADNPEDYAVPIPISFWQGNRDVENETGGNNFPGQMHRDASVMGAIYAQIYSVGATSGAFQNLKLTVRGDPYWLGQSDLHRQLLLETGTLLDTGSSDLPDFASGCPHIFVYFRYPLQTGDDFKPALKGSPVFNGLYMVTQVDNHFVDGGFKQELTTTRALLPDPTKWNATSPTNGGAASSPQIASQTNGSNGTSGITPRDLNLKPGTFNDQAPGLVSRLMTDFNLTQAQASGIVGNLGHESNGLQAINEINPTVPGSRGGFGWAQWTGPRRVDFDRFVASNNLNPTAPDTQYAFLSAELKGTLPGGAYRGGPSTLAALRTTTDVNSATKVFAKSFEGTPDATLHLDSRQNYAARAFQLSTPTG